MSGLQRVAARRCDLPIHAELSKDPAQALLAAQLRRMHKRGTLPLLSMDMDDTFLPFGRLIGERELDLLIAYLGGGGQLAFNTLAPKEWFYLRVINRLVSTCYRRDRAQLLRRVHLIVSGGKEIFVYDPPNSGYKRVHAASNGSKAEGLLCLLRHLDENVSILALYGDRFDDPGNDGNALGIHDIPLVINVGDDQQVTQSNSEQVFVNAVEKGPATTLRHLAFITANLRELSPRGPAIEESVLSPEGTQAGQPWRFGAGTAGEKPRSVEVHGPGFLWSWNDEGVSYLTALIQDPVSNAVYAASLPDGVTAFTFFWTGGPDTSSGEAAGHWEGRDFRI